MRVTFRLRRVCLPAALALSVLLASAAAASAQPASAAPDFFFGQPRASISLRGNWMIASAGSDLFDFVTSQLTVDRDDFNTGTLDVELGIGLTRRVDLLLGVEFSSTTSPSDTATSSTTTSSPSTRPPSCARRA